MVSTVLSACAAARLGDYLLIALVRLSVEVSHGLNNLRVELILLGSDVVNETALAHRKSIVVRSLRRIESARKLGLEWVRIKV